MSQRVTVYQIAERLGLSASTVSRVLNNSSLIGSETRELIERTAREMGYERRPVRRPKSRAILNILLFIPTSEESMYQLFYDPAQVIAGIHDGVSGVRINTITELADGRSQTLENRKLGDIDGAVFAFCDPPKEMIEQLENRRIPFIVLNRQESSYDYICLDNAAAMALLFDVAGSGMRRPLYLGLKEAGRVNEYRRKAFLDECRRRGLSWFKTLDIESFEQIDGNLVSRIREEQVDLAVCFNDIVAVSLIPECLSRKMRIPEDLSVTGSDNSPVRNIHSFKVDTIDLAVRKMGMEAGRWLYSWIIEKEHRHASVLLDPVYIRGNTVGGPTW